MSTPTVVVTCTLPAHGTQRLTREDVTTPESPGNRCRYQCPRCRDNVVTAPERVDAVLDTLRAHGVASVSLSGLRSAVFR